MSKKQKEDEVMSDGMKEANEEEDYGARRPVLAKSPVALSKQAVAEPNVTHPLPEFVPPLFKVQGQGCCPQTKAGNRITKDSCDQVRLCVYEQQDPDTA